MQKTSGKPLGEYIGRVRFYVTSHLITEALNLTQKREEQFAQLFNVSINMVKEVKLLPLIEHTLVNACQIIDAERCTLYLVNEVAGQLRSFEVQQAKVREEQIPLDADIAGFCGEDW